MKTILYLCFALIPILNINAQKLSVQEVYEDMRGPVLKDSKGRLWFTGPKKLTYFDGTWNDQQLPAPTAYNPNVISVREPLLLKEDKSGNIWTSSKKGLLQFDGKTWKLHESGKMSFANTTMIFVDYKNRVYFLTINNEVGIYDNGNWTFIKRKDLPSSINIFADGDNEVLFGNNEKTKSIGIFDGSYKLTKDVEKQRLFNKLTENTHLIEYSRQKNLYNYLQLQLTNDESVIKADFTDMGIILVYPDKIVIKSDDNERIVNLDANIREIISDKENINTITTYQDKLYIGLSDGLLEITGNKAKILNTTDGLAENNTLLLRTDSNKNLLVLHKNSVTIAINGKWHKYDKSNGFDFNYKGLHAISLNEWNNKIIMCNYNSSRGKSDLHIFEDNKWTTLTGNISNEQYAIANNGIIIFGGIKGGRLNGISYLKDERIYYLSDDNGMPAKFTKIIYSKDNIVWVSSISRFAQSFVTKLTFEDDK